MPSSMHTARHVCHLHYLAQLAWIFWEALPSMSKSSHRSSNFNHPRCDKVSYQVEPEKCTSHTKDHGNGAEGYAVMCDVQIQLSDVVY